MVSYYRQTTSISNSTTPTGEIETNSKNIVIKNTFQATSPNWFSSLTIVPSHCEEYQNIILHAREPEVVLVKGGNKQKEKWYKQFQKHKKHY